MISCRENTNLPESGSPFFPLGLGDSWMLTGDDGRGFSYTVRGIESFEGKNFWVVDDSSYKAKEMRKRYFRVDSKGNIQVRVSLFDSLSATSNDLYEYTPRQDSTRNPDHTKTRVPESGISTWYKLDAQPGDQWQSFEYFPHYGLRVCKIKLLSRCDTVRVGENLIQGCLKFEFDVVGVSDEEWYEWLAPAIGLVKIQNVFWREIQFHRKKDQE